MDEAVARDGIAPVETALAREVGELSSRLFDYDLESSDVPEGIDGVEGRIASPLGHQHVLPEVSEPAVVLHLQRQLDQPFREREIAYAATGDRGFGDIGHAGHADPFALLAGVAGVGT